MYMSVYTKKKKKISKFYFWNIKNIDQEFSFVDKHLKFLLQLKFD